jgi:hypothetical protein
MLGGASAYVGTLIEVMPVEAEPVVVALLDKYFGRPLPEALWLSQRATYNGPRRPYAMTGVYTHRLSPTRAHIPKLMCANLIRAMRTWQQHLARGAFSFEGQEDRIRETLVFVESELDHLNKRFFKGRMPIN